MAINKNPDGTLNVTNGDLEALKKIRDTYGLKDESDVLAFAIGVLDKSGNQGVLVRREDGSFIRLMPSDDIRKS